MLHRSGRSAAVGITALVLGVLLVACSSGSSSARGTRRPLQSSVAVVTPIPHVRKASGGPALGDPHSVDIPTVSWNGTIGPQNPNPMVESPYLITSSTHPLATLLVQNDFAQAETVTFDLFVTDGPLPSSMTPGTPTPYEGSAPPYSQWSDGVWDRQQTEPQAQDSVIVPSGNQASITLDWPQTNNQGLAVAPGSYLAAVWVSGFWLSGPLNGGGSVAFDQPSAPTATPTTGSWDWYRPIVLRIDP